MPDYSDIDQCIFSRGDASWSEKDNIYEWFEKRIESFISQNCWGDRCFVQNLEVMLAMLWRLSDYFGNTVVSKAKVEDWETRALAFFDRETSARGDAADAAEWRENLVGNFARLKQALDHGE